MTKMASRSFSTYFYALWLIFCLVLGLPQPEPQSPGSDGGSTPNTPPSGASSGYALSRVLEMDMTEAERLDLQGDIWSANLGYLVSPEINNTILKGRDNLRIADVACGTGSWLADLSRIMSPRTQLDGFDSSSMNFPPAAQLPPNVNLHVKNAKQNFSSQYIGKYDVVHIRLLVAALANEDEWNLVTRNVLDLLKPGGAIQWEEGNFLDALYYRADNGGIVHLSRLLDALRNGLRQRFALSTAILQRFRAQALTHLHLDVVSSDRCMNRWQDVRQALSRISIEASYAFLKGKEGWKDDNLRESYRAQALEEVNDGAYNRYDINVFTGFKRATVSQRTSPVKRPPDS